MIDSYTLWIYIIVNALFLWWSRHVSSSNNVISSKRVFKLVIIYHYTHTFSEVCWLKVLISSTSHVTVSFFALAYRESIYLLERWIALWYILCAHYLIKLYFLSSTHWTTSYWEYTRSTTHIFFRHLHHLWNAISCNATIILVLYQFLNLWLVCLSHSSKLLLLLLILLLHLRCMKNWSVIIKHRGNTFSTVHGLSRIYHYHAVSAGIVII